MEHTEVLLIFFKKKSWLAVLHLLLHREQVASTDGLTTSSLVLRSLRRRCDVPSAAYQLLEAASVSLPNRSMRCFAILVPDGLTDVVDTEVRGEEPRYRWMDCVQLRLSFFSWDLSAKPTTTKSSRRKRRVATRIRAHLGFRS